MEIQGDYKKWHENPSSNYSVPQLKSYSIFEKYSHGGKKKVLVLETNENINTKLSLHWYNDHSYFKVGEVRQMHIIQYIP